MREGALSPESLLSPLQVKEILHISRSAVYRLLDSGELPSFKIGKRIVVRRSDMENYVNRCQLDRGEAQAQPAQVNPDEILARVRSEPE